MIINMSILYLVSVKPLSAPLHFTGMLMQPEIVYSKKQIGQSPLALIADAYFSELNKFV